ncbi:M23 family metallopeptidase [Microbacterium timonense]|uniref:M23 family metallopeptidase n=1 Tax=Microbacterium timonense TaxID=2086576 RepID=UPI000D0EDBC8|nr:M23 family metallopeptidase [Microbacterium timonense]
MVAVMDLEYPFAGPWIVRNSPANRVPSHGTRLFASSYAIDFVPVDASGRSAAFSVASLLRPEAPQRFTGFGRPVLAPAEGVVVAVGDGHPDHPAYRGFPSLGYALTQRRRAERGWSNLAGNHILLESAGVFVALCHLQRGSITVKPGDRVAPHDAVARCGNSGNSTEPHLHVQAIDDPHIARARAVPMRFGGHVPRNGEVVGRAAH